MKGKGGAFSSLGRARVLETFPFPLKKPRILYAGCNNQFAPGKGIQQSWNLDSTQWIPDSGYWFLVPIISGILDSSSYNPDSKARILDTQANFPAFQTNKQNFPDSLTCGKAKAILLNCTNNRKEKSLRHVAMVAKFLDDNKPIKSLKSLFARFQTSLIVFNFI